MAGPLAGVRVLDLSREVAGAYATKLLADYGADVLKIEPPEGDPLRRFGPFPSRRASSTERSGLFLHLNTNKRSRILDVTDPANAERVRALAAESDIVVEDFAPGDPTSWGWGWEELSADRDDLVLLSITPFGQTGPYRALPRLRDHPPGLRRTDAHDRQRQPRAAQARRPFRRVPRRHHRRLRRHPRAAARRGRRRGRTGSTFRSRSARPAPATAAAPLCSLLHTRALGVVAPPPRSALGRGCGPAPTAT